LERGRPFLALLARTGGGILYKALNNWPQGSPSALQQATILVDLALTLCATCNFYGENHLRGGD
jgi:hypothetical protein